MNRTTSLSFVVPLTAAVCIGCGSDAEPAGPSGGAGGSGGGTSTGGAGGAGASGGDGGSGGQPSPSVRVAQYNISLLGSVKLKTDNPQVAAAADVIARFDPDIIAINEIAFDLTGVDPEPGTFSDGMQNGALLAEKLNAVTPGAPYEFHVLTFGNSGVLWEGYDAANHDPYFAERGNGGVGQFNYAVLSRYPILEDDARVIVDVAWDSLPGHVGPTMQADIGVAIPPGYPIFAKGLVIVPIDVDGRVLHLVMNHPFPPINQPVNPYRHHDELLAMKLLLDGDLPGVEPLPADARFVIAGDLNVDPDDGDALPGTIEQLFDHPLVVASQPNDGHGTFGNTPEQNTQASACPANDGPDPSTDRQLQLDYLMPSTTIGPPLATGMFFPDPVAEPADWQLACMASDHFLLWADLPWE